MIYTAGGRQYVAVSTGSSATTAFLEAVFGRGICTVDY